MWTSGSGFRGSFPRIYQRLIDDGLAQRLHIGLPTAEHSLVHANKKQIIRGIDPPSDAAQYTNCRWKQSSAHGQCRCAANAADGGRNGGGSRLESKAHTGIRRIIADLRHGGVGRTSRHRGKLLCAAVAEGGGQHALAAQTPSRFQRVEGNLDGRSRDSSLPFRHSTFNFRLLYNPCSASSKARSTARALFMLSSYSRAGTESATMPAPACR